MYVSPGEDVGIDCSADFGRKAEERGFDLIPNSSITVVNGGHQRSARDRQSYSALLLAFAMLALSNRFFVGSS